LSFEMNYGSIETQRDIDRRSGAWRWCALSTTFYFLDARKYWFFRASTCGSNPSLVMSLCPDTLDVIRYAYPMHENIFVSTTVVRPVDSFNNGCRGDHSEHCARPTSFQSNIILSLIWGHDCKSTFMHSTVVCHIMLFLTYDWRFRILCE
jgi:hypothetical protein